MRATSITPLLSLSTIQTVVAQCHSFDVEGGVGITAAQGATAKDLDALCSGHGACSMGSCHCEEGYSGRQCDTGPIDSPPSYNVTRSLLSRMHGNPEDSRRADAAGHTLLLLLHTPHYERIPKLIGMYGCLEARVSTPVRLAFLLEPDDGQQADALDACRCFCRLDELIRKLGRPCTCIVVGDRYDRAWPTPVSDAVLELTSHSVIQDGDDARFDLMVAHSDFYLHPKFLESLDRRALWGSEARQGDPFHRRDGIVESLEQLREVHGDNWFGDSARHCGRTAARLGLTHCAHQWLDAYYVPGHALHAFVLLASHFASTMQETSLPTILRTLHLQGGVRWAQPPVLCEGGCCGTVPWVQALQAPCSHRVQLQDGDMRFLCGAPYLRGHEAPPAPAADGHEVGENASWQGAAAVEDWATNVCIHATIAGQPMLTPPPKAMTLAMAWPWAWLILPMILSCALARRLRTRMISAHRSALGDEERAALLGRRQE